MLNVTLYSFNKRQNSTKQPSGGTTFPGLFVDNTSISSPSITFNFEKTGTNPSSFNYAFIPSFNRYYFISDWEFSNGFWISRMTCDLLASFKSYIGSSMQYVSRSSAEFDKTVPDNMYPGTSNIELIEVSPNKSLWNAPTFDSGSYVLSIAMGGSNFQAEGNNTSTSYVLSPDSFKLFLQYMGGNYDNWKVFGLSVEDAVLPLYNAILDPSKYITGCKWFPFNAPSGNYSYTGIPIAWGGISGIPCTSLSIFPNYYTNISFNLPKHPQINRGEYLAFSPYTEYVLNILPWGRLVLPPDTLVNCDSITVYVRVDCLTGDGYLNIVGTTTNGDDITFNEFDALYTVANIGVEIPVSYYQSYNISDLASSLTNSIGAITAASSGNITGVVSSGFNAIGDVVKSLTPSITVKGGLPSITSYNVSQRLQAKFVLIANENNSDLGRPLCDTRAISSIPGYIKTLDADVSMPALANEIQEIKSYMDGGFFFE